MSEQTTATAAAQTAKPHPLQFKWTLWHDMASNKQGKWADNLQQVASFDTVEDFWALFNNLLEPSKLPTGSTYSLFKYGIEPKWEDPQNAAGGEWRVTNPSSRKSPQLDTYWITTVLTVIGEGFSPELSDDIAGIVLNIKRGNDRIAIWTKTSLNQQLQESIGERWRATADILPKIEYIAFKDAMGGGSRRPRARYQVE